jgi:parvulin-like peptidyl-prolyl isomerase
MPEERWMGPVRSSKGFHLIYIVEKTGEEAISFNEAEERVYKDFLTECREELLEKSMKKIVSSYSKKIE